MSAAAGEAVALARWRADRDAELRAADGWLTVTSLVWLAEGDHTVGAAAAATVQLPLGAAPALVAHLHRSGDTVTLSVDPAARSLLRADGEPVPDTGLRLRDDTAAAPTTVTIGTRLSLQLLRRGARLAVRVRDREAPALGEFRGRTWYPPDPSWRLDGRYSRHVPPRTVRVASTLGDDVDARNPGGIAVRIADRDYRLEAFAYGGDPGRLQIVFRDRTSGHTTYGAARFLFVRPGEDDSVVLDFNRALSPPCAFTPHATCPLPPPQNVIDAAITAGETYSP